MIKKAFAWLLAAGLMIVLVVALLLGFLPPVVGVRSILSPPAQTALALVDVTVLNPGEAPRPGQTVLIQGGSIVGVQARELGLPVEYQRVEGAGRWVMPGLIDLHAHVFDESDLAVMLAHGVTASRNMMGSPFQLRMRTAVAEGKLAGARLFSAGPTLDGTGAPLHRVVDTPAQAVEAVRDSVARGFDLIKVYDEVSPEVFAAIVEEAEIQGSAVAGHLPANVPLDAILEAYVSVEHAEELWQNQLHEADDAAIDQVAARFVAHDTALVSTLQIVQRLVDVCGGGEAALQQVESPFINPLIAWMGRMGLQPWIAGAIDCDNFAGTVRHMERITARFHRAGVRIAVGTDYGPHLTAPGISVHAELQQLARSGLSNDEVLIAATRTPAAILGRSQTLGRVAAGHAADLLLLAQDPREDLANLQQIDAVIADGRLYGPAEQEQLQAGGMDHAGILLTIGRMLGR
jgi:imidazolonepropionase-like amidohydrolase